MANLPLHTESFAQPNPTRHTISFCKPGNTSPRQGQQLHWGLTALVCVGTRLCLQREQAYAPPGLLPDKSEVTEKSPESHRPPAADYVTSSVCEDFYL